MFTVEEGRILVPRKDFNVRATLECGQVFRFRRLDSPPAGSGRGAAYNLISADKTCVVAEEGSRTVIYARRRDIPYFVRYFDLETSYAPVLRELRARARNSRVLAPGGAALVEAALEYGRGLRILRQNPFETLISFIISTNNNIKRIRGIIERICAALGRRRAGLPAGGGFYAFPDAAVMAEQDEAFYRNAGCGYRAGWLPPAAKKAAAGGLALFAGLPTPELAAVLQTFEGVGPKAADCIALFAYARYGVFPVDTWVKKLYRDLIAAEPGTRGAVAPGVMRAFSPRDERKDKGGAVAPGVMRAFGPRDERKDNKGAVAPGVMRAFSPRDERKDNGGAIAPGVMRENLTGCFGRFAGIAQQFLFYYYRENGSGKPAG